MKFGRRSQQADSSEDPRTMFGTPAPPHAARLASATPLADHLGQGWPGVDAGYVVLPRAIAEEMSLPWQREMVELLEQFHRANRELSWPIYRVVPSRYERLVDLDEDQLAEAGYLAEMDEHGEIVYWERGGRRVRDPDATTVLVSCLDPIPRRQPDRDDGDAAGREPAPMNIGPSPVWHTQPPKAETQLPKAETQLPKPEPQLPKAAEPDPAKPRGWFDAIDAPIDAHDDGQLDDFGPTGEPTELPYRYRPHEPPR